MIYSKGNGCKIVFRPLEESKKAAPKSGPFTGGMNCNKNPAISSCGDTPPIPMCLILCRGGGGKRVLGWDWVQGWEYLRIKRYAWQHPSFSSLVLDPSR
jgi:hypothetical protein